MVGGNDRLLGLLFAATAVRRLSFSIPRGTWLALAGAGFLGVFLHQMLQVYGLQYTTAIRTGEPGRSPRGRFPGAGMLRTRLSSLVRRPQHPCGRGGHSLWRVSREIARLKKLIALRIIAKCNLEIPTKHARVAVVVAAAPPAEPDKFAVRAAQNYAGRVRGQPILLQGGNYDPWTTPLATAQLFDLLATPAKDLKEYHSDHRLPIWYINDSVAWFATHLK